MPVLPDHISGRGRYKAIRELTKRVIRHTSKSDQPPVSEREMRRPIKEMKRDWKMRADQNLAFAKMVRNLDAAQVAEIDDEGMAIYYKVV